MDEELTDYLDAIDREQCYRVAEVLKRSDRETTQKVFFVGRNGSERGPYVRKYFSSENGAGSGYHRIHEAQRSGARFMHIPRILDIYALDDTTEVVVLEYIEGETIEGIIGRIGGSVELAHGLFPSILNAVIELHTAFDPPIIHRDIKPSNIVVTGGVVTVIDFGIARSFRDDAVSDTTHFGTRAYAPPEQFGFGQTDERSDVYALGMLLYFMLSGETPTSDAREADFRCDGVPAALTDVVAKATKMDPDDRFQSVREMKGRFLAAVEAAAELAAAKPEDADAPYVPTSPPIEGTGVVGPGPVPSVPASLQQPVAQTATQPVMPYQPVPQPQQLLSQQPERSIIYRIKNSVAWNIVLVLYLILIIIAGISIMVAPPPGETAADISLASRVIEYGAVCFLMMPGIVYLLCGRDLLASHLPILAKLKARHFDIIIAIVMIAVSIFLIPIGAIFENM